MTPTEAKRIALGWRPSASLEEFYAAWQYLHDNQVILREPDMIYLDKLICDGVVK